MYYVYMHINKANGKKYIGVTNNIKRRWGVSGAEYKPNSNKNWPFVSALRKYGWDGFEHKIFKCVDTAEEAFLLEKFLIMVLDTQNRKFGYNLSPGGNGGRIYKEHPRNMLGRKQTEYQKQVKREQMSDPKHNPMMNGHTVWGVTHAHPRGFQGHRHRASSKARTSKTMIDRRVNCKAVKATYSDGTIEIFDRIQDACSIGLSRPVIAKLIKNAEPFTIKARNQYTERVKHLVGVRFEFI